MFVDNLQKKKTKNKMYGDSKNVWQTQINCYSRCKDVFVILFQLGLWAHSVNIYRAQK